ncbi:thioesterase family protein [Virgibacillus byunsanensis]|uniref:Thioesterase family protein n=1 Tax=Virgibacillus byunsanensis TaxID=570945 RepID=A0ABW3LLY6_9BACI
MENQSFRYQTLVHREWVDYNGHMNDSAYAVVFSIAVDRLIDFIGLDADARDSLSYTMFTLETHICYLQEAHENEELHVTMQLLDTDAKRMHVFFYLTNNENEILATSEQMLMGMDTLQGKPAPFPEPVVTKVQKIWSEHNQLELPKQAGRRIGIKKKKE